MEDKTPSDTVLLTSLKGHEGVMMHSSCVPYYESLVLLQNLRELFFKSAPDASSMVEITYPISFEKLKEHCPEYHKNIFDGIDSLLNIQLLKTKFPKYYEYINTFSLKQSNYWEFEELYFEIIKKINSTITSLTECEMKSQNRGESKVHEGKKHGMHQKINVEKGLVWKFNWSKSFQDLQNLFTDLSKSEFIESSSDYNLKNIFYSENTTDNDAFKNPKTQEKNIKKINFLGELGELGILFEFLKDKDIIIFDKKNGYYKLISTFFSNKGKSITNKALSNEISKALPYKKNSKYRYLLSVIKDSFRINL